MIKRPSDRRRSPKQEIVELPLVPIMDAMVTLIAFLLMTATLISVTLIDTPVPLVSTLPPEKSNEKPLTLTVHLKDDGLGIESPFNRITKQFIPRTDAVYNLDKFHEVLVGIKQKFPKEQKIIFMPEGSVKYDDIVKVMDASRKLTETDPPLYITDEHGVNKAETNLFSEVIFGNILGGT